MDWARRRSPEFACPPYRHAERRTVSRSVVREREAVMVVVASSFPLR